MHQAGLRPYLRLLLLCLLLAAPPVAADPGADRSAPPAPGSERASGAILGRVVAARDGRAIGGATVTARSADAPGAPRAFTATDGVFFLTGLAPGRYTVTASFGGFESVSVEAGARREARGGSETPFHLALHRAGETPSASPPHPGGRPSASPVHPLAPGSGPSASHMEARVRWEAAPPGDAAARPARTGDRFVVLELYHYPGAMPRQRAPELTEGQILVVGVDAGGAPRDWALLPDPTLLRAEGPDPAGRLEGETLRLAEAEFLVTLPADPAISAIRVYRPREIEETFTLELLGEAELAHRLRRGSDRPLTPDAELGTATRRAGARSELGTPAGGRP